MAHTLEFWKSGDLVMVEFNLERHDLAAFLRLPQARNLLDLMYDKIVTEYQAEVDFKKDRMGILADFITRHFLSKDSSFDVIVLGNGQVVKFRTEG
jgi:hypothetical protein